MSCMRTLPHGICITFTPTCGPITPASSTIKHQSGPSEILLLYAMPMRELLVVNVGVQKCSLGSGRGCVWLRKEVMIQLLNNTSNCLSCHKVLEFTFKN